MISKVRSSYGTVIMYSSLLMPLLFKGFLKIFLRGLVFGTMPISPKREDQHMHFSDAVYNIVLPDYF